LNTRPLRLRLCLFGSTDSGSVFPYSGALGLLPLTRCHLVDVLQFSE
jgi:hypothetical protein